ncbi:MAG: FGGY-family carbohydrate kinase [Defluviitaleaceae bacterium]|nr:FGGY-family carbohydrate kinase [Defluviitaleaceae bacterium]MCL2837095.1 FGGY-family carbohydrate kinase [Defluviitaleaceae bacterium]
MQYILAHDLGTSGNKATLYALDGTLKGSLVCDYPIYYPFSGAVEQNADDWWRAVCDSTKQLLEQTGISAPEVACACFSAQMMGCLIVDKNNVPLRPMLIWADTRSSVQEKYMTERAGMENGYKITGHRLSASYSAAKLLWIRDNEPELYAKAAKMLHAKEYIIYKLTGEIVTEYSDASGTNLLDINKKEWSQELLSAFGIPRSLLPDIYPSAHIAGKVTAEAARLCGLPEGTPVVIGGGDGSCACVGAGVVKAGKVYNVVGSSSWISTASEKPVFDPEMRTFNWFHLDDSLYTPCGTMQAAGYSYAWFRDALCGEQGYAGFVAGVSAYKLIDKLVEYTEPGANGLLFLPYLLGERSPLWDHNARGAFVGLGITSGKGDMARAILEGVGFNLKTILNILEKDSPADEIVMIGAGVKGDVWLQILSNIWQKPLLVPAYLEEATSMGAAICGGVGIGAYKDFSVAETLNKPVRRIEPDKSTADIYKKLYKIFRDTYVQLKPIYQSLAEAAHN